MRLIEFFNLSESPETENHSQFCVCKGKGYIEDVVHGQLPTLPGQNMGAPAQSLKKIPCPYGDLTINKKSGKLDYGSDDDWDL